MIETPVFTPPPVTETTFRTSIPAQIYNRVSAFEIPKDLRRRAKGHIELARGDFMERRVQAILSAQLEVKEVIRNKTNGEQDGKTHDLTVIFNEELDIEPIHIQVKSSESHVSIYKQRIKRKLLGTGSELTPNEWLIMDRTIALNGAKPTDSILINFTNRVAEILDKGPELNATRKYVPLFGVTA